MNNQLRARVFRRDTFSELIGVHLYQKNESGVWVARAVEMEQINVAQYVTPTFELDNTTAQELMDGLWHCGLRPSEGTGSAGAMAATQKHLEDMRKIAFLRIEAVGYVETKVRAG